MTREEDGSLTRAVELMDLELMLELRILCISKKQERI